MQGIGELLGQPQMRRRLRAARPAPRRVNGTQFDMAAIEASANGAGVVAAARCSPSVACNSTWALPAAAVVDIYAINSRAGVPVSMGLCTGGRAPLPGAPARVTISSRAYNSLPLGSHSHTCMSFVMLLEHHQGRRSGISTLGHPCTADAGRSRTRRQHENGRTSLARQRAEAAARAQAPLWRPRRAPRTC